jgi:hypothetical protein
MPSDFEKNVFINCPFDDQYKPFLRPLLFTLIYSGLEPRIASERSDSLEIRLSKIQDLIKQSRYSIHDISRMEALKDDDQPRFNMPFELGVDLGCRIYGNGHSSRKKCLILEKEKYRYAKSLSDLAGVDISAHKNEPEELVSEVREWIRITFGKKLASATVIWQTYNEFYDFFDQITKEEGFSKRDLKKMSPLEFADYVKDWLQSRKTQAKGKRRRPTNPRKN